MDHFVYAEQAARQDEIRRVTADTNYHQSSRNQSETTDLEKRLSEAEQHIDYLVEILSALLDELYESRLGLPDNIRRAVDDVPFYLKDKG